MFCILYKIYFLISFRLKKIVHVLKLFEKNKVQRKTADWFNKSPWDWNKIEQVCIRLAWISAKVSGGGSIVQSLSWNQTLVGTTSSKPPYKLLRLGKHLCLLLMSLFWKLLLWNSGTGPINPSNSHMNVSPLVFVWLVISIKFFCELVSIANLLMAFGLYMVSLSLIHLQ